LTECDQNGHSPVFELVKISWGRVEISLSIPDTYEVKSRLQYNAILQCTNVEQPALTIQLIIEWYRRKSATNHKRLLLLNSTYRHSQATL